MNIKKTLQQKTERSKVLNAISGCWFCWLPAVAAKRDQQRGKAVQPHGVKRSVRSTPSFTNLPEITVWALKNAPVQIATKTQAERARNQGATLMQSRSIHPFSRPTNEGVTA